MDERGFWERHGAAVGIGLGALLVALVVGIAFLGGWLGPPPAEGPETASPIAVGPTPSVDATLPPSSPEGPTPTDGGVTPIATAAGSPSPQSSPSPDSPPPATPPAVTAAPGSPAASATPTAAPTTPPSATTSPAATSPPPQEGWIEVTDFPTYRGGTSVESITAGGPGFVAVGTGGRAVHGRVWTSRDGVRWSAQADDMFNGFHLDKVVRAGDQLYLLGGNRDGRRAWQSSNGRSWSEIGLVSGLDGGVNDLVYVNGQYVAVGWTEDESGDSSAAAWRSTDGIEWQRVGNPEGLEDLWEVAARDGLLVAFPRWPLLRLPLLLYSTDLGDTWTVAQTDLGVREDFNVGLVSVAANDRRWLIVGYHELDDYVPLVLTSRDGRNWSSQTLDAPAGFGLQQVVALRGGSFMALGYGGTAHVSQDGQTWREVAPLYQGDGPPRPPEGGDEVVAFREVAAARAGVVVAAHWGNSVRVWFGPLSLFE